MPINYITMCATYRGLCEKFISPFPIDPTLVKTFQLICSANNKLTSFLVTEPSSFALSIDCVMNQMSRCCTTNGADERKISFRHSCEIENVPKFINFSKCSTKRSLTLFFSINNIHIVIHTFNRYHSKI